VKGHLVVMLPVAVVSHVPEGDGFVMFLMWGKINKNPTHRLSFTQIKLILFANISNSF
jgi:hypothetical protein